MNLCRGVTLSTERNGLCPTTQGRGRRTVTDNLQALRDSIATEGVDLNYLDPPFNSNATYNVGLLWKEVVIGYVAEPPPVTTNGHS